MPELLPYTLVRSKRKTLQLVINKNGELIARAPLRMSERRINSFVKEKAAWIAKKQQQVLAAKDNHPPLRMQTGEQLMYLGIKRTLVFGGTSAIRLEGSSLLLPENTTQEHLIAWLKAQAKQLFTQRVQHYANVMNVSYTAVKVSSAQHRWGSCSAKNSLNFAWRLILCTPEAIDYVVVHELSHVMHKNHGASFWKSVEKVLPDYKTQRRWLKQHGVLLELF